jgi:hypothetical protein
LASKKAHTSRGLRAEPRVDQELIDDQKFRQKLELEKFRDRIEREANQQLLCPNCASADWRMKPLCYVNWAANELVAVMVCRNCKRTILHGTHIEKDEEQEDEGEEEESEGLPFLFGVNRRRRRRRLSFDQRLRLLRFL